MRGATDGIRTQGVIVLRPGAFRTAMPGSSRLTSTLFVLVASCARAPATIAESPDGTEDSATQSSSEPLDDAQLAADLKIVVAGHLAVDDIGPDEVAAITARLGAHGEQYAQAIHAGYCTMTTDLEMLSHTQVAQALQRLQPHAPVRVRQVAYDLFGRLAYAPHDPSLNDAAKQRLAQQSAIAKVLAGGVDLPVEQAWKLAPVDRVCTASSSGTHALTVQNDCTCGEQPVCRVDSVSDKTIALSVRLDASGFGCTDCFALWSTCTVPQLPTSAGIEIRVNGDAMGSMTTSASGSLPTGVCIPGQRP